jgi:hypothetical protein
VLSKPDYPDEKEAILQDTDPRDPDQTEPDDDVRKLVSEGRQRQKVEKKEIKANSQTEATQLSHSEEQAGKSSPVAVSDTRFLARFRGG